MSTKSKSKKEKNKISKLIEKSDSENSEAEHELSYYINDRVKLMKEVLKIIKPKKMKSMAPDCIKDLDIEEINSMLLEELLGISNKRLKYIFNGQNLGEDSSSTDPEEEKQPIDVISLDDVSDDDFTVEVDSDKSQKKKHLKAKEASKIKKIKKEKQDKTSKNSNKHKEQLQEENLMSVLELLELQARARAIRSQLMLEANKKTQQETELKVNEDSDTDDVIIEIPKNDEIVITSSDSESEQKKENYTSEKSEISQVTTSGQRDDSRKKKIKLIRDRFDKLKSDELTQNNIIDIVENKEQSTTNVDNTADTCKNQSEQNQETGANIKTCKDHSQLQKEKQDVECNNDEDEIILIVDQEEMDGIIGES